MRLCTATGPSQHRELRPAEAAAIEPRLQTAEGGSSSGSSRQASRPAPRTVLAGGVDNVVCALHRSARDQHILQVGRASRGHQVQPAAGHNVQCAIKRGLGGCRRAGRLQQRAAAAAQGRDARQAAARGIQARQAAGGDVSSVNHSGSTVLWGGRRLLKCLRLRGGQATAAAAAAATAVVAAATATAAAAATATVSAAAVAPIGRGCGCCSCGGGPG